MDEVKKIIQEDKYIRWFLRVLTGILLIFYTGYIVVKKAQFDDVPLNSKDWLIILGSISMWAAWEAVRKYLNKKLEK